MFKPFQQTPWPLTASSNRAVWPLFELSDLRSIWWSEGLFIFKGVNTYILFTRSQHFCSSLSQSQFKHFQPGTHYCRVDRASMDWEVCMTFLHITKLMDYWSSFVQQQNRNLTVECVVCAQGFSLVILISLISHWSFWNFTMQTRLFGPPYIT